MVCTNPDLDGASWFKKEYCAGTLAEIFKKLGEEKLFTLENLIPRYINFALKRKKKFLLLETIFAPILKEQII